MPLAARSHYHSDLTLLLLAFAGGLQSSALIKEPIIALSATARGARVLTSTTLASVQFPRSAKASTVSDGHQCRGLGDTWMTSAAWATDDIGIIRSDRVSHC